MGCALLDDGNYEVAINELESAYEYMPTDIIKKMLEETKVRLARHPLESDKKHGENLGKKTLA